uniref:Protein phosphatase 1 regulatory subunit 12A n=1 Tax=Aceria tosichella TaxID=561515 RepID=A0A6G1SLN4_9ACAR
MSRNPYLASSRPTSSFTRSSRTSSRATGVGSGAGVGGLLGRSRSSATLGGLGSQLHTGGGTTSSPYSSSSLSASSHYVPSWQRSSSSTRLAAPIATPVNRASSPMGTITSTGSNQREQTDDGRRASSLYRSTSSHSLARSSRDTNNNNKDGDQDDEPLRHLKNYQQSKTNQPQPTRPSTTTTRATRLSSQSIDSDNASTTTDNQENNYSRAPTRSTTSLDSSTSAATSDDYNDSSIGDNIPSGSARHLRQQQQQQQGGPLSKSKSLDISSEYKTGQDGASQESPILFSTMSVDRLLLRADSMGERDLRKSFKELVMENERLKQQLKGYDDKDKQRQQDWIRKERQLHRKISELEEENKQIEHWKQEIQRLKDENNSLIRVVSKLSKQP